MLNATNTRNRSPFTPTQWQELEHHALIYKYMVSGVPIPPELIYSVKRSLESSLASRLFPHQSLGWGCFQVGFGRKADPEPGRCRRTDGKKWRCSKEAHPDSKYCERHMHRGRNRSRKPVELASTITSSTAATTTVINPLPSINRNLPAITSPSASSYSFSSLSSAVEPEYHVVHQNPSHSTIFNPFVYPHSSSSRPHGSGFSPQNSTTHNLFLDPGSSSHSDKDYRYFHGMREDLDERTFFPEDSGSLRTLQDSYQQLATSSDKGYSQSQFESIADSSKEEEDHQQQHCFVLGTDFKSSAARPIKLEKESETQKLLHHFFGEWPPKNSDPWLDLASSSRRHTAGN
uniref:Growth-regulating factor n=1 Tax=Manihot esculenta TaxID=3983 RepID=A0A2C9W3Y5_MANES